jgi:hypothetical protein
MSSLSMPSILSGPEPTPPRLVLFLVRPHPPASSLLALVPRPCPDKPRQVKAPVVCFWPLPRPLYRQACPMVLVMDPPCYAGPWDNLNLGVSGLGSNISGQSEHPRQSDGISELMSSSSTASNGSTGNTSPTLPSPALGISHSSSSSSSGTSAGTTGATRGSVDQNPLVS